jgi:flagellar biosynthesis protein
MTYRPSPGESSGEQESAVVASGALRDKAVALHYREEDAVPRVLASGAGEVARQILAIAAQHNVPIHKDAELVELLSHLPDGAQVPEITYDLIAEIVCFLYGLDAGASESAVTPQVAESL